MDEFTNFKSPHCDCATSIALAIAIFYESDSRLRLTEAMCDELFECRINVEVLKHLLLNVLPWVLKSEQLISSPLNSSHGYIFSQFAWNLSLRFSCTLTLAVSSKLFSTASLTLLLAVGSDAGVFFLLAGENYGTVARFNQRSMIAWF